MPVVRSTKKRAPRKKKTADDIEAEWNKLSDERGALIQKGAANKGQLSKGDGKKMESLNKKIEKLEKKRAAEHQKQTKKENAPAKKPEAPKSEEPKKEKKLSTWQLYVQQHSHDKEFDGVDFKERMKRMGAAWQAVKKKAA